MARYAQFDPAAPIPQPIVGWYDTSVFSYTNLPAENALIEVTDDQWDARLADPSGWVNNAGSLAAAPTPTPSLCDQAAALLAGGLTVTSTGTPARNAVYPCDAGAQSQIQAEMIAILANGVFADGEETIAWPDSAGDPHNFDVAGFRALASKIGVFAAVLGRIIRDNAGTLPSAQATIA